MENAKVLKLDQTTMQVTRLPYLQRDHRVLTYRGLS